MLVMACAGAPDDVIVQDYAKSDGCGKLALGGLEQVAWGWCWWARLDCVGHGYKRVVLMRGGGVVLRAAQQPHLDAAA